MSGSTPTDVLDLTTDPKVAAALIGDSVRVVRDDFAGPGGWSTGIADLLHDAGLTEVALEWDAAACATRVTNGHTNTIRADVATYPVTPFLGRTVGYIGSPPCQTFSMAGAGTGREHLDLLCECVRSILLGRITYETAMGRLAAAGALDRDLTKAEKATRDALPEDQQAAYVATLDLVDPRNGLILIPARVIRDLLDHDGKGPTDLEWVALEQVPPAGLIFDAYAMALHELGFSVAAPVINAADYGVPQTRERKFVLASRVRRVTVPEPTHARGGEEETLLGPGRLPWISMARALGWGMTARPCTTVVCGANGGGPDPLSGGSGSRAAQAREKAEGRYVEPGSLSAAIQDGGATVAHKRGAGMAERHGDRDPRTTKDPAPTITGGSPRRLAIEPADVELVHGAQVNAARRTLDQPAATIAVGHDAASFRFEPATEEAGRFILDRRTNSKGPGGVLVPTATVDVGVEPSPTLTGAAIGRGVWTLEDRLAGSDKFTGEWATDRPATVVASREIVQHPGATKNRFNDSDKTRNDGLRITEAEGGILQGFPAGYVWEGSTKGKRWEQIGNVVCPPVARRVVGELLGVGVPAPLPWHAYAWDEGASDPLR